MCICNACVVHIYICLTCVCLEYVYVGCVCGVLCMSCVIEEVGVAQAWSGDQCFPNPESQLIGCKVNSAGLTAEKKKEGNQQYLTKSKTLQSAYKKR